jgi:hypothetical protein
MISTSCTSTTTLAVSYPRGRGKTRIKHNYMKNILNVLKHWSNYHGVAFTAPHDEQKVYDLILNYRQLP